MLVLYVNNKQYTKSAFKKVEYYTEKVLYNQLNSYICVHKYKRKCLQRYC